MTLSHLTALWRRPTLLTFLVAHATFGQQPAQTEVRGHPLLVFVHGRGQEESATAKSLAAYWTESLDAGLRARGLGSGLIPPQDRRFVFYADVFRDGFRPSTECTGDRAAPSTATLDLWERVRRTLISATSKVPGLQPALADLIISDTYAYFSKQPLRCETDRRLAAVLNEAAVAGRPVVLVAHSMGSLVSLSVLNRAPSVGVTYDVANLITFGSQLGVEDVRAATLGSLTAPTVRVPPSVKHWTNVRAQGDALAFVLDGAFSAENADRKPVDVLITPVPGHYAHNARSYLATADVGAAVADAWCRAFREPARPPATCTK
jgi:pimeloyl-ACP methyl ester carboxylesterase